MLSGKLMEAVVEGSNMRKAYERVVRNKGAAGVDGMTVETLKPYLQVHWLTLKEELLAGRYQPMAVWGIKIPKPTGGMRQLGIPTVVDRLIQQAMHQVLCPIFDPDFSESSYGFRPAEGLMTRCGALVSMWPRDGGGWSTWIWRSSSTG